MATKTPTPPALRSLDMSFDGAPLPPEALMTPIGAGTTNHELSMTGAFTVQTNITARQSPGDLQVLQSDARHTPGVAHYTHVSSAESEDYFSDDFEGEPGNTHTQCARSRSLAHSLSRARQLTVCLCPRVDRRPATAVTSSRPCLCSCPYHPTPCPATTIASTGLHTRLCACSTTNTQPAARASPQQHAGLGSSTPRTTLAPRLRCTTGQQAQGTQHDTTCTSRTTANGSTPQAVATADGLLSTSASGV